MKKIMLLLGFLVCFSAASHAQGCSVCTKTASSLDDKQAKGLNGGIVYLAFIPLVIMGSLGVMWWRYQRHAE
jgi:hypothetical protein